VMDLYEILRRVIFILITLIGTAGNLVILVSLTHIAYQEHKLLAIEKIVFNLSGANLVISLVRGIPHNLFLFGFRNLYSDVGCKITGYVHITFRAVAIVLTCLLSCLQCATIARGGPQWTFIKLSLQKHLEWIIFGLYLFCMITTIDVIPLSISGQNVTNFKFAVSLGYCFVVFPDNIMFQLVGYVIFTRDFLFMILMTLASSYILLVLYRHGKQVQGIRSTERNHEPTAEGQAAKTVVTLVSFYVSVFGLDTTIWFYEIVSKRMFPVAFDIRNLFSMCYASFFPIVIITFNKKIRHQLKCPRGEQK
uniref:Vomeronasal type-1 receptor n=1 Tax=Latimeria chalumnae TaxID=7897 RepID=H2ZUA2_LATCH